MKSCLPFFALLCVLLFAEAIAARTVSGEEMKEKHMAERIKSAVIGKSFVKDFRPGENLFYYNYHKYPNEHTKSREPAETEKPNVLISA
ncbi:hypothetical protein V6N13_062314 [Hibiscus sabdariffa]|uniref:Uncharacterized protein n=2 Tax=Hibiscus sabdariffa TaxID=183260 RepID=A0ABR2NJ28_9ROSI